MNLHYKVIEVHPEEHSIVVRYYTDILTEEKLASFPDDTEKRLDGSPIRCRTDYNINVPIPAPEGQELENFIIQRAPLQWLDMQEKIVDKDIDTSLSTFKELMNITKKIEVDMLSAVQPAEHVSLSNMPSTTIDNTLTDDDILELLEKAKQGKAA